MNHNFENILILPHFTLKEALRIIDNEASRTVFVVDEKKVLLGIVTDGDVRRAILNGKNLDIPCCEIMNKTPKVVSPSTARRDAIKLMEQLQIFTVPIVSEGVVVGNYNLYELLNVEKFDNPIFIMAGGFGTRLRPLTDDCPKPMLKVGSKPLLETMITSFIKAGFSNFYISTHYMADNIVDYFGDGENWEANIKYVYEDIPLGTGGALQLLPEDIPDLPIIMINGDVLTKTDFRNLTQFHQEQGTDVTMCVREYDYKIPYGVVECDNGLMKKMVEKPMYRYFINAGIYILDPSVRTYLKKNEKIDMPSLLERVASEGKQVSTFPIHEYWLDIGHIDDFNQAQIDIKNIGL